MILDPPARIRCRRTFTRWPRRWQELAGEPTAFDVTDVRSRVREALSSELETRHRRERRREQAVAATRRLQELIPNRSTRGCIRSVPACVSSQTTS
jgi:hypothetical protein